MNVYLWPNQSVMKNAYIGEVREYDFTSSDWGWILPSGVTRDSNGLYISSSSKWVDTYTQAPSDMYWGIPKKITITYYKTQASSWIWLRDWSNNNSLIYLPRNQNNLNSLLVYNWVSDTYLSLWANPIGTVVWEIDIDNSTTNWTVTHKITWCTTVTDTTWALKNMFNSNDISLRIVDWEATTSIRVKSIVIEY